MSKSGDVQEEALPDSLTPEFWGEKYRIGDTGWDLGEVSPPFARLLESGGLKRGRMLIPGCGRGWEAIFFAQKGFDVTAADFAPEAIAEVERRAREAGVEIKTECRDFLNPPSEWIGRFDILLEQTCFCAIHPTRRPAYVEAAWKSLRSGGEVTGLFYHTKQSGGPPFDTRPEDVRRLFEPFFSIEHFAVSPDSHSRRRNQEWLGRFRKQPR
jgi:methyl halide transferase